MQAISEKVFTDAAAETVCCMDFMMDGDGKLYCLPGQYPSRVTPTSLIPQEAQAVGVSFEICAVDYGTEL